MSSFAGILRDFAESTTAHGVGRVSTSKSIWLRLFWLLAFLASLSVFIWQTTNLVKYYYSRPISVETKTVYGSVTFPAVTFCNLSPLRNSKLELAGEELQLTLLELEANINNELIGANTEPQIRKKRHAQSNQKSPESRVGAKQKYHMYDDDMVNAEASMYGFASSRTRAAKHRVKRGGPISSSSSYTLAPSSAANPEESIMPVTSMSDGPASHGVTDFIPASPEESIMPVTSMSNEPASHGVSDSIPANPEESIMPVTSMSNGPASHGVTDFIPGGEMSCSNSFSMMSYEGSSSISSLGSFFSSSSNYVDDYVDDAQDPADEYYTPPVDISDKPWFSNISGETTAEVKNTRKLSLALSGTDLETRRDMGYRIDGMLQECTWAGRICTPLNFSSFYNKKYGNCFIFNSGHNSEIRLSEKSGALFGLTMTLFIDQSDYIKSLSSGVGMRMLIHRQDEQPFPEENGFTLIPGLKTSVTLSKRRYDRLAEPYSNCTYGTTTEDFLFSKNYSTLACLKSCSQARKITRCQCADPLLSVPEGTEICTESATSCLEEIDLAIVSGLIECNCPEPCKEDLFVSSISTSTWPGEKFLRQVQQLFSYRDGAVSEAVENASTISENFIKVEVFFDEIKQTEIKESSAYDVEQLLADIGGQLGLWIGVSVLTGAEVIQLLLEVIVYLIYKKKAATPKTGPVISSGDVTYVTQISKGE